ncbi:iron export ABC transporter permease subunit FetB [bacterium]|nr:MAG: iron export ABC transporter permease subunit FetB [bacterium]
MDVRWGKIMNDIIHISLIELVAAAGLVAIAAFISVVLKLRIEKDMAWGTLRTFLQLLAVGYILDWVFSVDRWYLVAAMLFLMVGTASYNAMRRQTVRFRGLTIRFIISIAFASAVGIFVGLGLIVRSRPLWDPQYMIPIGGMIIGNAMTSGALAVNRLYREITSRRGEIEAALSLGASPHIASISAARAAVKAGMLPMISTMMVVGIVHLPGMMTGQIIGGVEPGQAVRYQIVIMYILVTTNALSALASTLITRRLFFSKRAHLVLPE